MWNCIATSTSGDYAIAGIYGGALYTSNNSAKSWYLYDNSLTNLASWFSVAISSTGKILFIFFFIIIIIIYNFQVNIS